MSDLINIGLSATRAASASLRMVGENIANADDPAYVRRRVLLTEATMPTRGSPLYKTQVTTGGVEIAGIGRSIDPLVDAALRRAEGSRAETAQRADWLTRLETAIGDGEFGVGARMTDFFAAGTRAVANPNDAAMRLEILNGLARVGEGFAATAQRIDAVDQDMTSAMSEAVATLNNRLESLTSINRDLRAARPGSAAQAQLFDRRDLAIQEIHTLVPTTITFDRYGAATLTVGATALVDGNISQTVTAARGANGGVVLSTGSGPITLSSGGQFFGMDQAGQTVRQRRTDLDGLAAAFVTDVNQWNSGGVTATGPGAPLLAGTDAVSVSLTVNDPAAIAAATPGGNPAGNLLALAALRGDSGGEEQWKLYVSRTAIDLGNARADVTAASLFADRAAAQRDAISGVDLDLEAAEMLRLQQAYGAAARVLQVARDTVQTILDIV
jgi:flagellar hook-associated protein 1 FlgK